MENNSRLFVGNLSYQTQERDIQDHFSAAGVVTNVNLMLDRVTGKSRGFAFVEFGTSEEANKAVELFHGKELGGRPLTVNIARPREERSGGGGGGGGFRGGGGGGYRGGGGGGGGGYRGDRGGGGGGGGGGWRGDRGGDSGDRGDRGGDRGGWRGDRGGDRY
jgi:cold-inducible RNA-binding protein